MVQISLFKKNKCFEEDLFFRNTIVKLTISFLLQPLTCIQSFSNDHNDKNLCWHKLQLNIVSTIFFLLHIFKNFQEKENGIKNQVIRKIFYHDFFARYFVVTHEILNLLFPKLITSPLYARVHL